VDSGCVTTPTLIQYFNSPHLSKDPVLLYLVYLFEISQNAEGALCF
jgi:hypothetical protein